MLRSPLHGYWQCACAYLGSAAGEKQSSDQPVRFVADHFARHRELVLGHEHRVTNCAIPAGARPDASFYIVGPRGSGKSTLLSKYTQPDKVTFACLQDLLCRRKAKKQDFNCFVCMQSDIPKPTEGLDYTFVRKPAANPSDPKELAHLWELSGSQELSAELLRSGNILGPEQVVKSLLTVAQPRACKTAQT